MRVYVWQCWAVLWKPNFIKIPASSPSWTLVSKRRCCTDGRCVSSPQGSRAVAITASNRRYPGPYCCCWNWSRNVSVPAAKCIFCVAKVSGAVLQQAGDWKCKQWQQEAAGFLVWCRNYPAVPPCSCSCIRQVKRVGRMRGPSVGSAAGWAACHAWWDLGGRAVAELVQPLPRLLTAFCMHLKQLTLKKQRQEMMTMSLLLLKDKIKGFSFSGKGFN